MTKVVSKECIKRANAAMIHGVKHGVSVDWHNVSVRCCYGCMYHDFSQRRYLLWRQIRRLQKS